MLRTVRASVLVVYVTVLLLLLSVITHAQTPGGNPPPNPNTIGGSGCQPGRLCNPLQSQTIPEFLIKIIDVLLIFAVPLIIIFIMYAGFQFVTARGNTEQITSARNALLWAIVGGVIVLGAKIIITVIDGTVKAF